MFTGVIFRKGSPTRVSFHLLSIETITQEVPGGGRSVQLLRLRGPYHYTFSRFTEDG